MFYNVLITKIFTVFLTICIYETILHKAGESGNIDLIKYIISMKKIDVNQKNILIFKMVYNIFNHNH